MKRKGRFLYLLAVCLILAPAVTAAPQKTPKLLDIDTFMEMESVGEPEISPDGRSIIFTRAWVDKVNDRSNSNLWIVDIDGKKARELTPGNWHDSSPVWSPEGKRV